MVKGEAIIEDKEQIVVNKDGFFVDGVDYSLVFDPDFYSEKYKDVKAACGKDKNRLFEHFIQFGMKEGRMGNESFNPGVYKSKNADLGNEFKNDFVKYYQHYCIYGHEEGRKCV